MSAEGIDRSTASEDGTGEFRGQSREQLQPSSIEKSALKAMGHINQQVIAALQPTAWTGSTATWLSGADEDCRSGGDNNNMQHGNLVKSKPISGKGKGISTVTFKKRPTISVIQAPDDWIEIEVTVDSGACETVMPSDVCPGIMVHRSSCSHGAEYEVANGESLPN